MDILNKKLTEIDISLQLNTEQTSKLLQDTQKTESVIESTFNQFRDKLNEREKELKNKLNEESNKLLNALKHQQQNLQKYKVTLNQANKDQNALILDPEFVGKKREIKIDEITKTNINQINNDDLKVDVDGIKFDVDVNAVNKVYQSS